MPSITTRYPAKIITDFKEKITGKKVNIVFKDGRVLFAMLNELRSNSLVIINMRKVIQEIYLDEIREIIIDSKV